jgi:hypothetical protein
MTAGADQSVDAQLAADLGRMIAAARQHPNFGKSRGRASVEKDRPLKDYRQRNPRELPLWQIVDQNIEQFEKVYPKEYASRFGPWRPIIGTEMRKFLRCGDPQRGYVWLRCDHCQHNQLLGLTCKGRYFCPSCHQKKVQTTARFVIEQVVAPVPHRQIVLTLPKTLRHYFLRNRSLLKQLFLIGHKSIAEYFRTILNCPNGIPGIIITLHTFGDYLSFNPHIHTLVADGLFVPDESDNVTFVPLRDPSKNGMLKELFRAKVINLLTEEKLIDRNDVEHCKARKVPGFTAYIGEAIRSEAKDELEKRIQYVLRNSFSEGKIMVDPHSGRVTYSSRWSHKIYGNSMEFAGSEFLAAVGQHIPDRGTQTVRYCGMYSSKMRGLRRSAVPRELMCGKEHVSLEHPTEPPSKLWRDLIRRVHEIDPLVCPRCHGPMRIVAVIHDPSKLQDDPRIVDQFLRYLGTCDDPP